MKALLKSLRDRIGPPLYRVIRKIGAPPETISRHLPFFGVFTVEAGPGRTFRLRAHGQINESQIFWRGLGNGFEHESIRIWSELASRARSIVDVGANSGIYSLVARALNADARIVALEPCERVYDVLCDNIRLNNYDIVAERVAASDEEGSAKFFDFDGGLPYSASLEAAMGGTVETEVRTVRLDDFIDRPVDLLKIDVERHEPAVLRGMRQILERDRPTVLIEVLDDDVRLGIEKALEGLDYRWTRVDDGEAWTNYLLEPGMR